MLTNLTISLSDLSDLATVGAFLVAIVATFYGIKQLREIKKATYSTAYFKAIEILQDDEVRKAREYVMVTLASKNFSDWVDEDVKNAEKVCQTYDTVGIMVCNGMLPLEVITANWGDSLRKTWKVLYPFVYDYREKRQAKEFWDDYEFIATEAGKLEGAF